MSQEPQAQFALSAINCDGPHDVNLVDGSVTVDVDSGQTVRCTFHNAGLPASVGYFFDVVAVKNQPQVTASGFNSSCRRPSLDRVSATDLCVRLVGIDVKKLAQSDVISIHSLPSDVESYDLAFGNPVPWRSATLDQPTPISCANGPDLVYSGTMEAASLYASAQVLAVRHSARVEILRDGCCGLRLRCPRMTSRRNTRRAPPLATSIAMRIHPATG